MKTKTDKNTTDGYNVALAFTEWLDKQKKSYFIVVRDIDGKGENLCAVNGDRDDLVVTLSSGMTDYEDIRALITKATLLTAYSKYAKEHSDGDDI